MTQIRILLADDDADHQRLLLMALVQGRESVDFKVASSAKDLLAAARRERFDCVVLDFHIPPYTAPDLIRELAPLQQDVPFIVVSSCEEQRVVVESLRNGVADFIPKDQAFFGDQLWKRIEQAVERSRSQRRERRNTNRRLRTLQKLAECDPLTGLYNRRFVERLLTLTRRTSTRRTHTSIVMIDIDHFKRVNDTLGHDAGDAILRQFADILREQVSPTSIASRWGGEEFLVLHQADSIANTWIWADGCRRHIENTLGGDDRIGTITASIGVAVVETGELSTDSISQTDHAMYLAKESGRNRTCTWPMAEAIDLATEMQSHPKLNLRRRLELLVDRLSQRLGRTQLDHVGIHGRAVRDLAVRVARSLLKDPAAIHDLELAAEFHDVGKIGVPEQILALPRTLSMGERRFIDEHARFGAEIVLACGANERISHTIEQHHTRFDASPRRNTDDGPNLADILSACDALVTMTSSRAYANARTPIQALAELRAERGLQFHPDVVDSLQFIDHALLAA